MMYKKILAANHSFGGWKISPVAFTLKAAGGDYGGGTENLVINEKILDTGKPTNGLKMQDSERECISDADKQDGNGGGTTYRCF